MSGLRIGRVFDPASKGLGGWFDLDPSDLSTHGIVIGMTGSGKTGLAVTIIEEALKARIPVIVVDPKGDMGNLALVFDRLAPGQFAPWIDRDEARREGRTPEEAAARAAARWRSGLADWGIDEQAVADYARSFRWTIYTPGSTAGVPLNLVGSLAPPAADLEDDPEDVRDEIDSLVTSLLGFIRVEADPIASREYILLSALIERAWRRGETLSLEALVAQVANPPIDRVGALPLDSFYPPKDRTALMLALNNLVASSAFEVWRRGEPLDIEAWVRPPDGVTRLSIISTAHLDDAQRTAVTAQVLNKLKTWMRRQPGTSELRVLFYMDEIFGYFPPVANPPTKRPLLTLLKQARAYGLGVLLSTQNPVDLDYKGLANMGFWAIGRLQTRQDQDRVRQGIEAALADSGLGRRFDDLIAGVDKRVFLIHDIHRPAPELVHSRWAMSYLRGPLTREEIRLLQPRAAVGSTPQPAAAAVSPAADGPPPLPAPLQSRYWPRHRGRVAEPHLLVKATARYRLGTTQTDETTVQVAFPLHAGLGPGELVEGRMVEVSDRDIIDEAPPGLAYADLPPALLTAGPRAIEKVLRERLDDRFALTVFYDPETKTWSHPGEDRFAFAARLHGSGARSPKRDTLETRLASKRSALAAARAALEDRRRQKWVNAGTSILGGVLGGRRSRPNPGTLFGKSSTEQTAERRVAALEGEVRDLEQALAELDAVNPSRFEPRTVKPASTAISVLRYDILWVY
jgi:hypothetical protein